MDCQANGPDDSRDDLAWRSVFSEVVSVLGSPFKGRTSNSNTKPAAPSEDSGASQPTTEPMIRPSRRQRALIDAHRYDWP